MKRFISRVGMGFSMVLYGCSVRPKLDSFPKEQSVLAINFGEYSKTGFLITPFQYLGDYESIGLIQSVNFPAGSATQIKPKGLELSGSYNKVEWKVGVSDPKELIDSVVSKAIFLGANALVDFEIIDTSYVIEEQLEYHIPALEVRGYKATGFAIKRLGAFKEQH